MIISALVCELLQEILQEKEGKFKASMQIAGTPDWVYWLAWYKYMLMTLIVPIIVVALVCDLFVFSASNIVVVLLFFITAAMSFTSLTLSVSACLFNAALGSALGTLVVWVVSIPGFLLDDESLSVYLKYFILLLPPCAYSYGLGRMCSTEIIYSPLSSTGITLSNVFKAPGQNEVSFGATIVFMFIDTFIWAAVAWYLEKVVPDQWGKCMPVNFIFTKDYWNGGEISKTEEIGQALANMQRRLEEGAPEGDNESPTSKPSTRNSGSSKKSAPGLEAMRLRKVYGEDPKTNNPDEKIDDTRYYFGDVICKSEQLVKSRRNMQKVVTSGWFEGCIYFVIGLNMLAIIFDNERFHNNDEDTLALLDLSNYLFCIIFSLEMFYKIYGLSADKYFKDPFNCFDFLLVVASYVEIVVIGGGASSAAKSAKGAKGLKGARAAKLAKFARFAKMVRVLRIARLLRWFTYDETKSKTVVALDSLDLTAYKEEIMSLLGQNGAGKTTFFSMLMGIAEPTSGYCYADGANILVSRDIVKKTVGSCPQHDILFDNYSIEEHLILYGILKGIHPLDIKDSVAATLKHVGLTSKKDEHVNRLSGGMRRRTSIALACLGDPKIILLDEPSAGVDIVNRQIVWKTLVELKKGRTIIMSTHFMEEAEILGDRVAVLKKGKLQVVGTCSELHNKFGAGYTLVITRPIDGDHIGAKDATAELERTKKIFVKKASQVIEIEDAERIADEVAEKWEANLPPPDAPALKKKIALAAQELEAAKVREINMKKCDPNKILAFIRLFIKEADVLTYTEEQAFLEYVLPFDARTSFSLLFEEIDKRKDEFGFEHYGISAPTLQEIFLEISDMGEDQDLLLQEEAAAKRGRRRSSIAQQKENVVKRGRRRSSLGAIRGPGESTPDAKGDKRVDPTKAGESHFTRRASAFQRAGINHGLMSPDEMDSINKVKEQEKTMETEKEEEEDEEKAEKKKQKMRRGSSFGVAVANIMSGKNKEDSANGEKKNKNKKSTERSSTQKYRKDKKIMWSPGAPHQSTRKQLRSMVVKRFVITQRNRKAMLLQGLLPIFIILMGVLFTTISHEVPSGTYEEFSLELNDYYANAGLSIYHSEDSTGVSAFGNHATDFVDNSIPILQMSNISKIFEDRGETCVSCYDVASMFLLGANALAKDDKYAKRKSYDGAGLDPVLIIVETTYPGGGLDSGTPRTTLKYNATNYMVIDGVTNLLSETYQRQIFDEKPSLSGTKAGSIINAKFHGLPMTTVEMDAAAIPPGIGIMAGILIFMSFASITASQCNDAVTERETGCKRQQLISGVNPIAYWSSNYIFDTMFYFAIPFAFTLGIVEVFSVKPFSDNFQSTINLLVWWGFASPSFAYVASFIFERAAAAQQLMMTFNTVIVLLMIGVVLLLEFVGAEGVATPIRFIVMLCPQGCLGFALWTFIQEGGIEGRGTEIAEDGMLPIYIMIAQTVVYFVLTIAMENTQDKAAKGYAKSKVGTLDEVAADGCQPTGPSARYLRKLTDGQKFKGFIFSMIIVNMVVVFVDMSADDASDLTFVLALAMLNYLFTFVFFVEMVLKLGGYGPIGYCKDPFNIFDGILVTLSLVELFLAGNATFSAAKSGKVVGKSGRMLKLLRLFKFAKLLRILRYARFMNVASYEVKRSGAMTLQLEKENLLREDKEGKGNKRDNVVKRLSILGGEYVEGSAVDVERKRVERRLSRRNTSRSVIITGSLDADMEDDYLPMERNERNDAVAVHNLIKVYESPGRPPVTATNDIGFGVREGEILSLLGPNGAGKSTVLNIMTGSVAPTSGEVYVLDKNISTQFDQIKSRIGFCPQFDALIGYMNSYETLTMFARIKGIDEEHIQPLVDSLIQCIGLGPHAHKMSFQYSGGNKRKLSVAISLLGNPDLVFLDEPSTGMDPASLTDVYSCVWMWTRSGKNRSIVLTTHSMEEADSLSNRIAILVNGKLAVLGSAQDLKSKFGMNYTFESILSPGVDLHERAETLKALIEQECPGATDDGSFDGRVRYELPQESLKLSNMFKELEGKREELQIKDYTISQTTLEQVFIHFAQHQF